MTAKIKRAVQILKSGGVVVFPTETVYGLGARLWDERAIRKIFSIKGRPADNPLIVHIANLKQFSLLTRDVPAHTEKMIEKFWPGPLTLVCKRSSRVPSIVTAGLDTVALRMPKHPMAMRLLRALGEPLAAPSANRSKRPSATRAKDVIQELGGKVDLVLDGGPAVHGLESTVVDVTRTPFMILRPGFITLEKLRRAAPRVGFALGKAGKAPARSPGTRHPHYQPSCRVVLVDSSLWGQFLERWKKQPRVGVLSFRRSVPACKNVVFRRKFASQEDYARNLYASFFEAEKARVQVLLAEAVSETGLGLAIMDRLRRAAERQTVGRRNTQ